MRAEDIVSMLHGRGHYPKWRAKCPVHRSRGLTLAIKAGSERISITCHAGCHSDDVLAAVGLKWQDMLYNQEANPEAIKAARRIREAEDRKRVSRLRIVRLSLKYASLWKAVCVGLAHLENSVLFDQALGNLMLFERIADSYDVAGVRGLGIPKWNGPISSRWIGAEMAKAMRRTK